jgi:putative transposase
MSHACRIQHQRTPADHPAGITIPFVGLHWRHLQKESVFVREIGGMPDHVHLLIQQPPTMALSDIVQAIKAGSSQWMGTKFAWQRGFGGFSVSASKADAVVRYIRNQERHHRKMPYEEEIFAMYRKHGMRFDPKYALG